MGGCAAYQHAYRVPPFAPGAPPDQLSACGRHFRTTGVAVVEEAPPDHTAVATFAPPLHESMTVLARPALPACGMELLLRRSDGRYVEYELLGGP